MIIEGIVIRKQIVKDHDLVIDILTRTGEKLSVYCYGAQSSRKGKAACLEIGMMNRYEIKSKSVNSFILNKVEQIWFHQTIRFNFLKFIALSVVCELVTKIATPRLEEAQDENKEIFAITSNVVFYLDKLEEEQVMTLISFFLLKIMNIQGIMFNVENCIYSEQKISSKDELKFDFAAGGFAIASYCSLGETDSEDDALLWKIVRILLYSNFKSFPLDIMMNKSQMHKLFSFLCFQLNFSVEQFKSFKLLLNVR